MRQLIVEPEFRDKIPPLSPDEFSKLEENILADGEVREPLVVWNNTIVDGHHRWAIIQKHPELSDKFKIKQMDFPDKWAAIAWMCRNQLGRRNLTDEQKTYLIGKQYEAQKMTSGGDRKSDEFSSLQNEDLKSKTKDKVARELGVGSSTVERSEHFAKGIDAAETVSPGIRDAVLSGHVKAPKNLISEIRNVPEDHLTYVVEAIKSGDTDTAKAIIRASSPKRYKKVPEDDRPQYDLEDFRMDLMAAVNTFDAALRQHMILAHMDILMTKDGKEIAESVLLHAKDVIRKYFKHVDSIKEEKESG